MPLPNRGLTMRAQRLMALGVILLLAGCKGQALPLPFVSKRTSMVIEIEAAGNINSHCNWARLPAGLETLSTAIASGLQGRFFGAA